MEQVIASKKPADTRVVVAMSGGVDSSVVCALLAEAGYDVVGVTLQLYDHGAAIQKKGACCAGQDIYDARRVADSLGVPHYVLDYESRFRDAVIDDFADTYARGETPIPCVRCNQTVKFRDLLATARDLGADALATGHYVRRSPDGEGPARMLRAVDPGRDQSYFLFATTTDQLDYVRFPLGGMEKSETRAHAERFNLPVASKPDSQDICFVPDGDYASIVRKLRPEAAEPGDIVDLDGQVVGRHEGVIHYTVGQRRGLGIGGTEEPLYVVRLEPTRRRVVVGPREALGVTRFMIGEVNWIGDRAGLPAAGIDCQVKVRSTTPPVAATVRPLGEGRAEVTLAEPQRGVSPGQACVLYDGDLVLGGGWIRREEQAAAAA
ncbi:MAG: tRNA 2-thiouridine(34) synthase MnmA [Rhodospirillales bacterium]